MLKNTGFRADISLWKALGMETWQEEQVLRKDTVQALPAADAMSAVPAQTVVSVLRGSITQGCRGAQARDAQHSEAAGHGRVRHMDSKLLKRFKSFCCSCTSYIETVTFLLQITPPGVAGSPV